MSFSLYSRGTRFISWMKVPIRRAPFLTRHQPDVMGSRYNSIVGPSNDKIYSRTFRFDCRCFMPMHGYKLRNSNLQESFSVNLGHRYSAHATMEKKSRKMFLYLTGLVFAMVGCCYAAVPLYKRFCQDTGYGGTVQRREIVEEKIARHMKDGTVTSREIIVQFNADVADGMPWKFIPTQREVRVKPGESALAFYTAENRSLTPITGVSTYNVTPMKIRDIVSTPRSLRHSITHLSFPPMIIHSLFGTRNSAAIYFNKVQCFCFEEQRLLPGEQIDMPVFFYIDPEFETDPKMDGINNLILSYTFFKVSEEN
ncbi:hypothetical protein OROGR_008174 [Orobanche gracilis]